MHFELLVKSSNPLGSVKDDTPIPLGFDMVDLARDQLKDSRISPRSFSDHISCDYNTYWNAKDKDKLPGERRLSIDVTDLVRPEHATAFQGRHKVTIYVPPGFTGQYAALKAAGQKETEGNPYHFCKNMKCSECASKSVGRCNGLLYAMRFLFSPATFLLHKLTSINLRRHYSLIDIENKLNVAALYIDWIEAGAPTHWKCTPEDYNENLFKALYPDLKRPRADRRLTHVSFSEPQEKIREIGDLVEQHIRDEKEAEDPISNKAKPALTATAGNEEESA